MSRSEWDRTVPLGARPAVEAVRANPKWYFPAGTFELEQLLGMLTSEAVSHGSRDILLTESDQWWTVASSDDWLRDAPTAFEAPTRDPVRGANVSRVEILLTAFCPRVITVAAGVVTDIVGTDAPPISTQSLLDDRKFARVIAFLPPSTPGEQRGQASGRHLHLVPELDAGAFNAVFEGLSHKEREFANAGGEP